MHIAICGPISLRLLKEEVTNGDTLPEGYPYPFAAYLAKEYIKRGHRVSIVTSAESAEAVCSWKGIKCSIVVTPYRARARNRIKDFYRKEVRIMRDELMKLKPDIIHAQWTYEFADAALSTGLPTIVTARDSPFRIAWIMKHPFRWARAVYATFWVLPRCRHLTAISAYMRSEIRRHGYFRAIPVIPNGIEEGRFSRPLVFGIKNIAQINIYCIAEWGKLKNVMCLLQAYSAVREKFKFITLNLVGRGLGSGESAEQYSLENDLSAGVFFNGYQSQEWIDKKLRTEADLFISPTIEESFGMIFVEAMSQGVACIGGNMSGAVPWVLDNGNAGFLIDVRTAEKIKEGLIEVLQNPEQIEIKAKRGYERAKELFLLEKVADQYLREYERVSCSGSSDQSSCSGFRMKRLVK